MCLESRSEINGRIKTNGRRRYLKEESGRSTYIVVTEMKKMYLLISMRNFVAVIRKKIIN